MPLVSTAAPRTYRLQTVWPEPSEAVREEVVQFWLTELPLSELAAVQERAHQLLVVARDPDDRIAGVSTALRMHVEQLGFECFFYRTFVGREHRVRGLRSTGLFWDVLLESYRVLNDRFLRGCDPSVLGLYAEIENPSIMRVRNEVVWRESIMNAVFIGKAKDGRHIRVQYFDGARIP
jgi:hypothetical protein